MKRRDLCLKGPQELDELMRLLIDLKRRVCSRRLQTERLLALSSNFAQMGVAAARSQQTRVCVLLLPLHREEQVENRL